LQIPRDRNLADAQKIKEQIELIDVNWIESVDVIKEASAVEKYGALGQSGVVVIHLKDITFNKLPAELRKCEVTPAMDKKD
jgi:hypothetical protein